MGYSIRYFFISVIICISSTTSAETQNPPKFRDVGEVRLTSGEWKPFLSEKLSENGFASAVVKAAYEAVGIEVTWGFFPWKRSFILAREGTWDGSVVWVKTTDRLKDFIFSDPVVIDNEYVYSRKISPINWKTIEDLRPYTFSLTLHATYPALEEEIKNQNIKVNRAGGYESLFPRLIRDRSDGTVMTSMVADFFLRNKPSLAKQIYRDETILYQRKYHLMISKKNPNHDILVSTFNAGLRKIKKNGTYYRLTKKLNSGYYDPK